VDSQLPTIDGVLFTDVGAPPLLAINRHVLNNVEADRTLLPVFSIPLLPIWRSS